MAMRTLDIFCGVGGSSYGARIAGAEIVCGVDAWKLATDTFKSNFSSARVFATKLQDIDPARLRRTIGDIDLLLASPECTNHTCAKGSAKRSELSRETAFQVTRFAAVFAPKWIVIENVIQMRRWRRYGAFCAQLRKLGYKLQEFVLNAKDFGAPQSRRRLFVVGAIDDTTPALQIRKDACKLKVDDILDRTGSWKMTPLFREGRAHDTIVRYLTGLEKVGPDESFLLVYYGTDGGGGWQRMDRVLRTVTTVDRFALVDQSAEEPRMRMLQVPELRRAMGFGNDFTLPYGTRREKIKLLGNAVCPPLMAAIVEAIVGISSRVDSSRLVSSHKESFAFQEKSGAMGSKRLHAVQGYRR